MISAVEGLVRELRSIGIQVSVSEKIDGLHALRHVRIEDREAVKSALSSALIKNSAHESAYSAIFDIFFDVHGEASPDPSTDPETATSSALEDRPFGDLEDATIRQLLLEALTEQAQPSLLVRLIAAELVHRHAGIQPGRAVAGKYYLFRTLRAVDPNVLLSDLISRNSLCPSDDELLTFVRQNLHQHRVTIFEQEIESEIRRRLVSDRGAAAVATTLRHPLPEDIEFLTASVNDIAELREVLTTLSKKLAIGFASRNRKSGALDFRGTVRRSMSMSGSPLELVFRRTRPTKSDLFVLADISGSVATFAAFTLQLTYALGSEFSRLRSFVFIDGLDEVTTILTKSDNIVAASQQINAEGHGVWLDGRSDYGNALDMFWQQYGAQVNPRTTVLILGDARTNYRAHRGSVLGKIRRRAGNVYWLNPESKALWDSGDSVIGKYVEHCSGVFECRNIRQLRAFIEHLH